MRRQLPSAPHCAASGHSRTRGQLDVFLGRGERLPSAGRGGGGGHPKVDHRTREGGRRRGGAVSAEGLSPVQKAAVLPCSKQAFAFGLFETGI